MKNNLKGKTAFVTGAERGLGACIALRLARNGADVIIHYLISREDALNIVKQIQSMGQRAIAVHADFCDSDQMGEMYNTIAKEFNQVDILVNNAGAVLQRLSFMDIDCNKDQLWEQSFYINYMSVVRTMREFLPGMIKSGWGRIVNITSISSRIRAGHAKTVHYSPMKSAVACLSEQVASEVARFGVTVNCVAPGVMDTPLLKDTPGQSDSGIKLYYPIGRKAQPDEIAAAVEFLVSPDASYVIGEEYFVAGGR